MMSSMMIIKLNIECGILLIIMITTPGFNVMMNVMGMIVMTDITFITTSSNPYTT